MTTREVIECFRDRTAAWSSSLTSTGEKLISYSTCIAQWYDDEIWANMTRYSKTTSNHQNKVVKICSPKKIKCEDIPQCQADLTRFIKDSL